MSNEINMISDLSVDVNDGKSISTHKTTNNTITKIFGLDWSTNTDTLQFKVHKNHLEDINQITKREILSKIACLFDPLGLIGPYIVCAKLMLQRLWLLKTHWD